jgi:hypothetical protein
MGFHKRYIKKEIILSRLKSDNIVSLTREISIDRLFNADALIMDTWSCRFHSGLKPEERNIRSYLNEKYIFDSGFRFMDDIEYKKLTSLSEALVSLSMNPTWVDICFVLDKLKIKVDSETESGKFQILVDKCKMSIIGYFDGN